ncbi:MAG: hypothetical protein Q9182_006711 [Xanthomendoza sp. 2 TL-2023]
MSQLSVDAKDQTSATDPLPWQVPDAIVKPSPAPLTLTQEDLRTQYREIQEELHAGDSKSVAKRLSDDFRELLSKSNVDNISKCICTSLGSFTVPDGIEEFNGNRPLYQLAAFEIMKLVLEDHLKKKIKLTRFQDLAMNNMDIDFLQNLGYEVIEHPQALEEVARDVFVYMPVALYEHMRDIFHRTYPAVYVGDDLKEYVQGPM